MSSWTWVRICILIIEVECNIILTKSDRTIIYNTGFSNVKNFRKIKTNIFIFIDESKYKPTPIPLAKTVQVCIQV